jgi:hypothetical protein
MPVCPTADTIYKKIESNVLGYQPLFRFLKNIALIKVHLMGL